MSILLNWRQQPGQQLDSIEIYRFAPRAVPDPNNLGTPYVVLAGTATSYEDTAVDNYATYQYRVVSVKGTDKVMGLPIVQAYYPQTGPGPQDLLRGDWWNGYFGTLTPEEFFLNAAELNGLMGQTFSNQNVALWHKFVYKGKILFIPDTPTTTGYTYNQMYSYGLVWGTNDTGKFTPSGQSARNQYRTVKKNGYEYIVRLPQAVDRGAYSSAWYNDMTAWLDSEWANTWCRLFRISLPANYPSRVSDRDPRTGNSATDAGCAVMQQGYNNQYPLYYRSSYPQSPNFLGQADAGTMYHVFELVLS